MPAAIADVFVVLALVHLGLLFAVAGFGKLVEFDWFEGQLTRQRILPVWSRRALSRGLPPIEFATGLWLFSGVEPRLAAFSGATMLFVFVLYRARLLMVAPENRAPCGCLGRSEEATSVAGVVGVTLNLLIAIAVVLLAPSSEVAHSWTLSVILMTVSFALFASLASLRAVARMTEQRRSAAAASQH